MYKEKEVNPLVYSVIGYDMEICQLSGNLTASPVDLLLIYEYITRLKPMQSCFSEPLCPSVTVKTFSFNKVQI